MSSTMASSKNPPEAMTLYDIALRPPAAPNPWKARLTLNFKAIDYSTKWIPLPEIAEVRRSLGIPAGRKFADGSDFYTLPILIDPNTNAKLGDTFDIALHLQDKYADAGAGDLFPPQPLDFTFAADPLLVPLSAERQGAHPAYARFNTNVDAAFTTYTLLVAHGMPFEPAHAEASRAEFLRRAGAASWDDFKLEGEAREKTKEGFRSMLGDLARLFERDASGPFLLGARASYADLMVGAWLRMMHAILPDHEWKEVAGWHGGIFGRLHEGLDQYAQVK